MQLEPGLNSRIMTGRLKPVKRYFWRRQGHRIAVEKFCPGVGSIDVIA